MPLRRAGTMDTVSEQPEPVTPPAGQPVGQPPGQQVGEPVDAGPPPPRWGLLDAVGALLGFVVLSLVVSGGLVWLGLEPAAAGVAATLAGWVSLAGWPILVARRRGNGVRSDLALAYRPVDLGLGLLASLVVFGAAAVFLAIYLRVTGDVPTSAVGDAAQGAGAAWQVLSLALLSLAAPFVEELHFRGMWWSALRRRGLRPWPTLLVTSALFALVHLEPERAPLLFAAGLAAGFVRMLTGRLGPAFVTHFIINALAAISLLALL